MECASTTKSGTLVKIEDFKSKAIVLPKAIKRGSLNANAQAQAQTKLCFVSLF